LHSVQIPAIPTITKVRARAAPPALPARTSLLGQSALDVDDDEEEELLPLPTRPEELEELAEPEL